MQLTIITIIVITLMCLENVKAQIRAISFGEESVTDSEDTTIVQKELYVRPDWKKVDVNFLSSYYEQDGNNAAVTGGIGTEYLTDFTQKLIISFPTSKTLRWNVDAAYDYYSSASTDNIDNIRSSDSSSDIRSQLQIGVEKTKNERTTYGLRMGTSVEYDYTSANVGLSYSHLTSSGNTRIDFSTQMFYDVWSLIYPTELRRRSSLPTDKRQSYNSALSLSQVVHKRIQLAFMMEATYMKGLLSTPFHRVYFREQDLAKIESLPAERLKIPLGFRCNIHVLEKLILRSYYRYYWDSWGMEGHTVSLELPIKLTRFFAIYPHYRYHTQTAIDYFMPYKEHSLSDNYYTSDYDLSELSSHSYGVGLMYSRPKGIASIRLPFKRRPSFDLEAIDLKYSHYDRSTGLKANIISIGLKMSF